MIYIDLIFSKLEVKTLFGMMRCRRLEGEAFPGHRPRGATRALGRQMRGQQR